MFVEPIFNVCESKNLSIFAYNNAINAWPVTECLPNLPQNIAVSFGPQFGCLQTTVTEPSTIRSGIQQCMVM